MSDQRPQYGELATPEEQRIAAGLPPVAAPAQASASSPVPDASPVDPGVAPERPRGRPHPVDRLVTIALLAYGLVNVVITAVSYLDPTAVMNQTMEVLGIDGEFTNFAQGKVWGTIAAVVLLVGWGLTAAASIRRLRRGKITWWLPLVGAVITIAIASMCIAVPMMGDPAFVAYMDGVAGS